MSLRAFIGCIGALFMLGGMISLSLQFDAGIDPSDRQPVSCGSVLDRSDPNLAARSADSYLSVYMRQAPHFEQDCNTKFESRRMTGGGIMAVGAIALLGAWLVRTQPRQADAGTPESDPAQPGA